jgi:bifunctional enzyme CysN/CysC
MGRVRLSLDRRAVFDQPRSGGFISRMTGPVSAAYQLRPSPLGQRAGRRSIDKTRDRKKASPCIVWFTGLSGAGKPSIANLVEREEANALGITPTCGRRCATDSPATWASPRRVGRHRRIASR